MDDYELEFLEQAATELGRLDRAIQRRVWRRLEWLRLNVDSITPEALTGPLAGLFKFRVGDYRILYELIRNERRIIIHAIGHRRDVYRQD